LRHLASSSLFLKESFQLINFDIKLLWYKISIIVKVCVEVGWYLFELSTVAVLLFM